MATVLSRWMATVVLAAGLGTVAMAPTPARAGEGDDWVRVVVDVADVIYHSGYPYYRYDNGYRDRLIVVQDYGRPRYYRRVYRAGPPYGNAYGYYNNGNCNKHGKCTVRYYDGRYDHHRDRVYYSDRDRGRYDNRYDGNRYVRYDDDGYRDDRRHRDHDDD
ncbi:hypothetical protein AB4Y64_13290 [Lysobacter sp. TAF61]|uniref:hypothetical protein n=1 Tax=Lysobacter sp. TAF61 TaxID=3233072 RepID=UPI003F95A5F1